AVAVVAGVVDEHPVARAGDDLLVGVALDRLGALALRGVGGGLALGLGRLGGRGGRGVLVLGALDRCGLDLSERRARRAGRRRAVGLGRRGGGGQGGDGVGHERGAW